MENIIKQIKSVKNTEEGFTLIEMMVTILIIGILAAIATPIYLKQRQEGYDFAVKSEATTAGTKVDSVKAFNSGKTPASLSAAGYVSSSNDVILTYKTDGKNFCIIASHEGSKEFGPSSPYSLYNGLPGNCPTSITVLS